MWGKREGQHGRLTLTSLEIFCAFPEPKLGCSWDRKRLELFQMCLCDFYLAFLWNQAVNLIIPHAKNADKRFDLFSKRQRSTYPLTSTTLQSSSWHFRCTYRDSDLLCTLVYSASKPGVTQSGFLALTSNGENEYVLTSRKDDAAWVPCTYPFRRQRALLESGRRRA